VQPAGTRIRRQEPRALWPAGPERPGAERQQPGQ
jgi:hypothetical protein